MPFLDSKFSYIFDLMILLQVLCLALVVITATYFLVAQLVKPSKERHPLKGHGKVCTECDKEVVMDASYCTVCGECVDARQHRSVLLNRCVGNLNVALYQTLMTP